MMYKIGFGHGGVSITATIEVCACTQEAYPRRVARSKDKLGARIVSLWLLATVSRARRRDLLRPRKLTFVPIASAHIERRASNVRSAIQKPTFAASNLSG